MVTQEVTVASGATESSGARADQMALMAIITPAALTSTSATLYGSADGTTYYPIYADNGAPAEVQLGTSRWVACYWPDLFLPYVRLEMASAEGDARTLTLVFGDA